MNVFITSFLCENSGKTNSSIFAMKIQWTPYEHLGQSIQEWTKLNLLKTAF